MIRTITSRYFLTDIFVMTLLISAAVLHAQSPAQDDIDVDKDPHILQQFDTIILLHNEFVTENEFNAITSHPNVIYLYPNAFNSLVESDYSSNTITLVRGPGFPTDNITNGFDWEYDNSEFLNDWECNNWKFYQIDNGFMLNCFPEKLLTSPNGKYLLESLKTF